MVFWDALSRERLGVEDSNEARKILGCDLRIVQFPAPPHQADFEKYLRSLPEHIRVGDLPTLRSYHEWGYDPSAALRTGPASPLRSPAAKEAQDSARADKQPEAHRLPRDAMRARRTGIPAQVEAFHREGAAVIGLLPTLGGVLLETAWRLRGWERFLEELLREPHSVEWLLDQLTELQAENATFLAESEIDVLMLGDDIATPTAMLIGPEIWRRFFKPKLARIVAAARSVSPNLHFMYHSDGCFEPVIPDLLEIGITGIEPVQPEYMDPSALRRRFGKQLVLWGTVGAQALWRFGSPDEVRAEVIERWRTLGPTSLVLAPAYDLEPTDSWENLLAFFEAARAAGC
jgi:uroporphyrinogen decarboxylase